MKFEEKKWNVPLKSFKTFNHVNEQRHNKTCLLGCTARLVSDLVGNPEDRFLAHLSRRLKGELIVYRSIRRPLVSASVRPCVCA